MLRDRKDLGRLAISPRTLPDDSCLRVHYLNCDHVAAVCKIRCPVHRCSIGLPTHHMMYEDISCWLFPIFQDTDAAVEASTSFSRAPLVSGHEMRWVAVLSY